MRAALARRRLLGIRNDVGIRNGVGIRHDRSDDGIDLPPQREAHEEDEGEDRLGDADDEVRARPAQAGGDGVAHDERADGGPDAPEAVQPVHVARRVVQGDVVVEGGIHRARAESVGDRPEAEHPELPRSGEAEQGGGGHRDADGGDQARAEAAGEALGREARQDRAARDDHGDDAGEADGDVQTLLHDRPPGAEERVGQAEADEGDVDDGEQEGVHNVRSYTSGKVVV